MTVLNLQVEFFSYWQCGTGRGGGVDLDGVVSRDRDGLPHVPGKTFKGIFKDALFRYLTMRDIENATEKNVTTAIEKIFGEDVNEKKAESKNYRFNSVCLPACDRDALAGSDDALKTFLYKAVQSTAINEDTGVAKTGTLRMNEVVIPLRLETEIQYIGTDPNFPYTKHFTKFKNALPFFYIGIGGGRRRGLGRVKVTVSPNTEAQNAA